MPKGIIIALVIAVGSGIAIGMQGTLNNWAGKLLGAISTGLLVNLVGGMAASIILPLLFFRQNHIHWDTIRSVTPMILVSGLLGIVIITGIAYSLPRVGIAAGLSAIIFGQMAVALVVDSIGWGGDKPIPFSIVRGAGLAFLLTGTLLLLWRGK